MKTLVYTLNLKTELGVIQKYKEYHKKVWPEVIASLKKVGIINCRIYLLGNRLVNIMDVEDNFNPNEDFKKYTDNKVTKEWDELMCTFQEKVKEAREDEWWAVMEMVFDMSEY